MNGLIPSRHLLFKLLEEREPEALTWSVESSPESQPVNFTLAEDYMRVARIDEMMGRQPAGAALSLSRKRKRKNYEEWDEEEDTEDEEEEAVVPVKKRKLNAKGVVSFDDAWDSRLEELRRYRKVHGDCLVVTHFESGPGMVCAMKACKGAHHKQLGAWVAKQRKFFKKGKLSEERRERLEAVDGWQWDPFDSVWSSMLEEMQDYQRVHKTCRVPQVRGRGPGKVCPNDACDGSHKKLGSWVRTQRKLKKKGSARMTDDRILALNAIPGWLWVVASNAD